MGVATALALIGAASGISSASHAGRYLGDYSSANGSTTPFSASANRPSQPYTPSFAQSGMIVTGPGIYDPGRGDLLGCLFSFIFVILPLVVLVLGSYIFNQTEPSVTRHSSLFLVLSVATISMSLGWIFRMVYADHPKDIQIFTASNIFFEGAYTMLIGANLFLLSRWLKSEHPRLGWHAATTILRHIYTVSIGVFYIIWCISNIQPLHTLSPSVLATDALLQKISTTHLAVAAILPLPVLGLSCLITKLNITIFGLGPRDPTNHGIGHRYDRLTALLLGTSLLSLGSVFRCLVTYFPRPRPQPAWYHGGASFYLFNIVPFILLLIIYCGTEVDQMFWFPKGYRGPEKQEMDLELESVASGEERSSDGRSTASTLVSTLYKEIKEDIEKGSLGAGSPPRRNGRY